MRIWGDPPGGDIENIPVSIDYLSALWIGSKKIGFLAILLKRDRNHRPHSHKLLGHRRLGKCGRDKTRR
jgi:hypothetical protein